jgi:hypothetical protein
MVGLGHGHLGRQVTGSFRLFDFIKAVVTCRFVIKLIFLDESRSPDFYILHVPSD